METIWLRQAINSAESPTDIVLGALIARCTEELLRRPSLDQTAGRQDACAFDVSATIVAGDQRITLRFDPERLTPPKLDNTSKPAPRSEGAVVVEALLRSLQPAVAKDFESLPADAQETFRKAFSTYLATYPTASDANRLVLGHEQ